MTTNGPEDSRPSTPDSASDISIGHSASQHGGSRRGAETYRRQRGGVVRGRRRTVGGEGEDGDDAGSEDERLSTGTLERRERERREANMREWELEMAGDLDRQRMELIQERRNKAEVYLF